MKLSSFVTLTMFGAVIASAPLGAQQVPPAAPVRAAASGTLSAEVLAGISIRAIGPGLVTGRVADIEPRFAFDDAPFRGRREQANERSLVGDARDPGGVRARARAR